MYLKNNVFLASKTMHLVLYIFLKTLRVVISNTVQYLKTVLNVDFKLMININIIPLT